MKRFFLSEFTFKLFTILGAVLLLPSAIWGIVYNASQGIFIVILMLSISLVFTYRSYVRHEKNVMKCLIGMVLTCVFIDDFLSLCYIFNDAGSFDIIIESLHILADVLLIINHLIINSDHHSSPKHVKFSQYLVGVELVLSIIGSVPYFTNIVNNSFDVVMLICDTLGFVSIYIVIVCIESRLDAYRIDRELFGWEPEDSR